MGFVQNLVLQNPITSEFQKKQIAIFKACLLFFLTTAIREKPRRFVNKLMNWIVSAVQKSLLAALWTL
jgi:hypothetical protein